MKHLIIALFAVLPMTVLANDASEACLRQVKQQILRDRQTLPQDVSRRMRPAISEYSRREVGREDFTRTLDPKTNQPMGRMGRSLMLAKGDSILAVLDTILPGEADSINFFTHTRTHLVFSKRRVLQYRESTTLAYREGCRSVVLAKATTAMSPAAAGQLKAVAVLKRLGEPEQKSESLLTIAHTQNAARFNLDSPRDYISYFLNHRDVMAQSFTAGSASYRFFSRPLPAEEFTNAFTGQNEVLEGVEHHYATTSALLRTYVAKDNSYTRVVGVNNEEVISVSESVPSQTWVETRLTNFQNSLRVERGFSPWDFNNQTVVLQLSGSKTLPTFSNLEAYNIQVQPAEWNGSSWTFKMSLGETTLSPTSLPVSAPVSPEDARYLRMTKYIQREPVAAQIRQLKPQISGTDRLTAAIQIAEVVSSLIEYDYDMITNGFVAIRSTENVMKNRKGVCQHYAVVYASIARSLGIPTRIRSGYSLNEKEAIGHAWVEVKVNDTLWYPIEPQEPSGVLQRRNYIPVYESAEYEVDAQRPEANEIERVRSQQAWDTWRNILIQKVSAQ